MWYIVENNQILCYNLAQGGGQNNLFAIKVSRWEKQVILICKINDSKK